MHSLDRTSFIETIREHQGIINSICNIYYRNDDDIKDARQDIILQLWKSYATFRNEAKISTWIYRVALNTVLSKIRKAKKDLSKEPLCDAHFNISPGNNDADDNLQQLLFLLNSLEETDKAIMILYLEGYSHKEIAETLKFTPTNISTRINRITGKLKETFKTALP